MTICPYVHRLKWPQLQTGSGRQWQNDKSHFKKLRFLQVHFDKVLTSMIKCESTKFTSEKDSSHRKQRLQRAYRRSDVLALSKRSLLTMVCFSQPCHSPVCCCLKGPDTHHLDLWKSFWNNRGRDTKALQHQVDQIPTETRQKVK